MRFPLLLSFILLGAFSTANAQILELDNKWIYDFRDYSLFNGSYTEKFDSIHIVSDTLINGLKYYKLVSSEQSPCGIFTSVEYLREEDDKIFRLSKNLIDEKLMIDFTAQNAYNMTYDAAWFNEEIQTNVVNDSIGIEILPSGKQIELTYQRILSNYSYDDNASYKLSRDIGYIQYGLLFPDIGTNLCDVYEGINLRCKINGNDTIKLTELDCYETSIISSINQVDEDPILLYPNPANDVLIIPADYEIIVIQNLSGSSMSYTINNTEVDISDFLNGIYFITIKNRNGNQVYIQKVIKM